jgi:hypothetical protein
LAFILTSAFFLGLEQARPGAAAAPGGLAIAGVFPSLGLIAALQLARNGATRPATGALLKRALSGLGLASLTSLTGGLLIVGLYAKVEYLEGVGQFAGVKISYLLPLALVTLAAVADLSGQVEPLGDWWAQLKSRVIESLRRPISWGSALLLVVTLAALAVTLMRSGNDSPVPPSTIELKMRGLLEWLLIARPRTKEFLFGHPALMLTLALAMRGRRAWIPLAALVAVIGQVSLLNTFCHFHMPLYLGLLRTVHGVWLGALIGLVLILIWRAASDPAPRIAPQ